jgi:release factor glutamine methyltransferase
MTDLAERRGVETAVYDPAEDSELLASVAVEHVDDDHRVLDVGTGSGYVARRVRDATGARVVATDVNPHACRRTSEAGLRAVRADLVGPFRDESFDRALFNPPYLPREPAAERDDWMERALTGGESGRAVIESFLEDVGRVLAPGGRVLLLVSTLTDVEAVAAHTAAHDLAARTVREESHPFERLVVLEITPEH